MLPVIVKLLDRFFRKIIGIVLFDPHTSTLMPALDNPPCAALLSTDSVVNAEFPCSVFIPD